MATLSAFLKRLGVVIILITVHGVIPLAFVYLFARPFFFPVTGVYVMFGIVLAGFMRK